MFRLAKSRLLLGTAAAAVAVSSLASGCSGSAKASTPAAPPLPAALQGEPTQVVAAAAGRTVTSTTAGVTLTAPVLNEGQLSSVNGEGSIDFSGNRMKLVVPNAEKAEERQFGRQLYVLLPEQAAPMLGGKQWVKLDLDTVGSKSADPFNLYAYEPRQLVTALTAVHDASLVGSEQVRDTRTTHFTGTVDGAGVASSGAGPTFVKAFRAATKNAATPVDVWLDDEGLVRKMSLALPPAGAPAGNRAQATVELYDFGTSNVSFAEPPSTKVATPTDLTSLAGSGD